MEGRIQNSVGGRGTDLRGFIVMAMKRSLSIGAGEGGEARESEQEEESEEAVEGKTLRVYGRVFFGLVESSLLPEVDEYVWCCCCGCCCGCCMIVCLSGFFLLTCKEDESVEGAVEASGEYGEEVLQEEAEREEKEGREEERVCEYGGGGLENGGKGAVIVVMVGCCCNWSFLLFFLKVELLLLFLLNQPLTVMVDA